MSKRLNHNRPVHQIAHREVENKYADKSAFIPTRVLMKAKTWQDIIDFGCKSKVRKDTMKPTR